tara:strand:- start:527 stop:3160 length:2634 start_codon:yes stop_codon:yes gene_type:complete
MASIKELLMEAALWGDAFLKAEQRKDAREAEKIKQELMLKTQELTNKINDQKLKLAQKEHERLLQKQEQDLAREKQEQGNLMSWMKELTSPPVNLSPDQTKSLTKSRVIGDEEKSLAESGVDTTAKTGAAVDLQESLQSAIAKPPEDIPANMQKVLQEQMQRQAQRAPVAERETARRRLPAPARGTAPPPTAVQAQPTATAPGALMPGVAAKTGVAPPTTKPETIDVTPYVDRAKEIPPKLRATDTVTEVGKDTIAGTTTDIPKGVQQTVEKQVGPLGKEIETIHTNETVNENYYGAGPMRNMVDNLKQRFPGVSRIGLERMAGDLMEQSIFISTGAKINFPGSTQYREKQVEIRDSENHIIEYNRDTGKIRRIPKNIDISNDRAPWSDIKSVMDYYKEQGLPFTLPNGYATTNGELAEASKSMGLKTGPVKAEIIEKGVTPDWFFYTIERDPTNGKYTKIVTDIRKYPQITLNDLRVLKELGITDMSVADNIGILKHFGITIPDNMPSKYDKMQLVWADDPTDPTKKQAFWAYANSKDATIEPVQVPLLRDGNPLTISKKEADDELREWSLANRETWKKGTKGDFDKRLANKNFNEITHQFFNVLQTARDEFNIAWSKMPLNQSGQAVFTTKDNKKFELDDRDVSIVPLTDQNGDLITDENGGQVYKRRIKTHEEMGTERWQSLNAPTQALIMSFNKILDYASTVRESEYARTGAGQGIFQWVQGLFPRFSQGGAGMTKREVEDFYRLAEKVYNKTVEGYKKKSTQWLNDVMQKARTWDMNPYAILPSNFFELYGVPETFNSRFMNARTPEKRKTVLNEMWNILYPQIEEDTPATVDDPNEQPAGTVKLGSSRKGVNFMIGEKKESNANTTTQQSQ